jgi:hypothetical protein
MTWMTFLFPTSQDKSLKGLLVAELRMQIAPLLQSLGFQVFRPRDGAPRGFPTHYYRVSPSQIDVIEFMWRNYGLPAFIIDFDVIDDLSRFTSLAEKGSETWFNAPRYRARSNSGKFARWFHIGYLPRLISARNAARNEVEKAKARIIEIDRFAKSGETSPYFRSNRDFEPVPARKPKMESDASSR